MISPQIRDILRFCLRLDFYVYHLYSYSYLRLTYTVSCTRAASGEWPGSSRGWCAGVPLHMSFCRQCWHYMLAICSVIFLSCISSIIQINPLPISRLPFLPTGVSHRGFPHHCNHTTFRWRRIRSAVSQPWSQKITQRDWNIVLMINT